LYKIPLGGKKTEDFERSGIYPPLVRIREVSARIAVAGVVFDHGLADVPEPGDMEAFIRSHFYEPNYPNDA